MIKSRKSLLVFLILTIVIIVVAAYAIIPDSVRDAKPATVVVRIDDVQDFAFKDAQLYLLRYNMEHDVPMSLAVIGKAFGSDKELVDRVASAVQSGSEVLVHGWEHENLAVLSLEEQEIQLQEAKEHLRETLGLDATVLAPPMFSYNNDTLRAMQASGYTIVSGLADLQKQGPLSQGIVSIPATIELSDFANGTWRMKSVETIVNEVDASTQTHGYAVIVTHPQEFIHNDALVQDAVVNYEAIVQRINARYSFTTIEKLKQMVLLLNQAELILSAPECIK